MRYIQFNEIKYILIDRENVSPLHFQATIKKEDHSLDDILEDLRNIETITVKEDNETVAIYEGYTSIIAVSIHSLSTDADISIELLNTDIESQVNNLTQQTASLDAGVTELAENVAILNETQDSQDAAIEELAEALM